MNSLDVGTHMKVASSEARDSRELRGRQRKINRREDAAKRDNGARLEIKDPPGVERAKNLGGVEGDVIGAGKVKLSLLATDFKAKAA